jgi:membrane protein YqaA with SNARE-associated domain
MGTVTHVLGERAAETAQRVALTALRPRRLAEAGRNASPAQKIVAVIAVVAFNIALFLVPIDYAGLGAFAYPGAFFITLIANAAVVVPVPYIPIVAHIAATADSAAVVVLVAALGSALGEAVAFAVGRVEKDLFTGHPWFERLRGFFGHEWRAGLFLFLFAMPLNPVFDVGGLAAGALGISFRTFFVAVFLGRIVRFTVIALIAFGVLGFFALR